MKDSKVESEEKHTCVIHSYDMTHKCFICGFQLPKSESEEKEEPAQTYTNSNDTTNLIINTVEAPVKVSDDFDSADSFFKSRYSIVYHEDKHERKIQRFDYYDMVDFANHYTKTKGLYTKAEVREEIRKAMIAANRILDNYSYMDIDGMNKEIDQYLKEQGL